MLKKLVCLLLFSVGIAAAQNTTTLSGTISMQDGTAFNGTMKISMGKSSVLDTCTAPPHLVANFQTVVAVVNGIPDITKTFITTKCLSGVPYFVQFFDTKNTDILDANWYILPESNTGTMNVGDLATSNFGGPIVVSVPTPIVANPAAAQIVTQPTGTNLTVNNLAVTNSLLFSGTLNLTTLTATTLTATNLTATHIAASDIAAAVSVSAPAVSGASASFTGDGKFGGKVSGNTAVFPNGLTSVQSNGGNATFLLPSTFNLTFSIPSTATQGYATDGTFHYLFSTSTISKRNNDSTWTVNTSNPTALAGLTGATHVGDGEYYGGKLYAPAENYVGCPSSYTHMTIAVYDATSAGMPLLTSQDISGDGHEASSIAVVPSQTALYMSSFCDGSKLWIYDVTTLTLTGTLTLSQTIPLIQGITYNAASNSFFVTADNSNGLGGAIYQVAMDGTVSPAEFIIPSQAEVEGVDYTQSTLRFLVANEAMYFLTPALPAQSTYANNWTAAAFSGPLNYARGRLGIDHNAFVQVVNARYSVFSPIGWFYDDSTQPAVIVLEDVANADYEVRVCPPGLTQPFTAADCTQFSTSATQIVVGQGSSTPDPNTQFAEFNPTDWTAWSIKTAGVTDEGRLGHDINGTTLSENMRWDGAEWLVDDNTVIGSMVMVRPDNGVLVRVYPVGNTTTPFEWQFAPDGTLRGPGGTIIGANPIANVQISTGTTLINAHDCTASTATSMPGLLATSVIIPQTPTSDTYGVVGWGSSSGLGFIYYVSADTLHWRVCNSTGSSITPGASITWNVGAK